MNGLYGLALDVNLLYGIAPLVNRPKLTFSQSSEPQYIGSHHYRSLQR